MLRYRPAFSVGYRDGTARYFIHEELSYQPDLGEWPGLAADYLRIMAPFWIRSLPLVPGVALRRLERWIWDRPS